MRSEWQSVRAADVIDFNPTLRLPKGSCAPKVAMEKLLPFTKRIEDFTMESYSGGAKFCNGDTIMARITPCLENGKTAFVDILQDDEIGYGSTEYIVLRAKAGITDPQFVYYLATSPDFRRVAIKSMVGSSGRQRVQQSVLDEMTVLLPPLPEQVEIGRYLSMLDDQIALNNRINDNFLQQAMAIFNDRYDSADGQRPFTSLIHVLGGGTPKTGNPEFWNGDIPFFTPKDVGSPYTFHTEKTITSTGLEHCNSRLFPKNTSFVTARGTVGKVSLAGKPMAMNQSCYALASDSIDPILVYFYTLRAIDSLKHKASGAVFDAIVTRDFETEVISVIPESESKAVLALIAPMLEAIHTNTEESIRLAALRDALLPRLMSGEIDVSNIAL